MGERPRSIGRVDRNKTRKNQPDELSTLWQELAETVARAQRLVNERANVIVKHEPRCSVRRGTMLTG